MGMRAWRQDSAQRHTTPLGQAFRPPTQPSRWMRCMPREVVMTSLNSPLRRVKAACSNVGSHCPRETQPKSPHSCPAFSAVEHSECCWQSFRKATSLWLSRSPSAAPPCPPMRKRLSNILTNSASASAGVRGAPAGWPPRATARGLRAIGSSGRPLPGSAQRSRRCRTRTDRGPGATFWRFACRLMAKRSSMMPDSPSSSTRSRTQTQMAEAEESCCLPGRERALLAHWRAATLGCHWQILAEPSRSEAPSSAVAPQQSATRMASPTRHEALRTAALHPRPRRSRRPSASRPPPRTPSARRRSAAAPGAPPCRANLKVSSAVVKASKARRASASASLTCALTTRAFIFSKEFFIWVSSASASTFRMAAAPFSVKGSQRRTRWSSRQASPSCSAMASTARAAASTRSKAAFAASGLQSRTLSGCTRRAKRLYADRASAGPSGPPAAMPRTVKESGARTIRPTASSVVVPASAPEASCASQADLARRSVPSSPRRAPVSEARPLCSCPSCAAVASSSGSGSKGMGSASSNSSVAQDCPATATTRLSPTRTATQASHPPKPWGPANKSRSKPSRCSRRSTAREPT
mmetsp:Transcript_2754/g.8910  ORF Transcript_2754/g.8910 Transcript_2754/m.8910 type:complete len:582 (+) Transcript_2754:6-1751(+)